MACQTDMIFLLLLFLNPKHIMTMWLERHMEIDFPPQPLVSHHVILK